MTVRRVAFSEIMTPNSRPYTLGADEDADLLGMRWYGFGPFHRERKPALRIAKKTHFVVRAGDVIYNKLFAWRGSFGIVTEEQDGMFVSDKFPTYALDRSQVDERYLAWFFRYPEVWEQAQLMSTGSAALSKLTLNPPKFLDLKMPLPPLDKQRMVSAELDRIAARLDEARKVRTLASELLDALGSSGRSYLLEKAVPDGKLGDVLEHLPRNGWSPVCDNRERGTAVLALSAVTGWQFNAGAIKRTSLPVTEGAHYWLEEGDLLITRSNTPEFVGHAAIYTGQPSPCIYPDLMMKLKLRSVVADLRFVWHWLQSNVVREYIRRSAKGTSPTMKKISQRIVSDIPFPTSLSVEEQRKIAAEADRFAKNVVLGRGLQDQVAAGMDAILPAVLDRAFKGKKADAANIEVAA